MDVNFSGNLNLFGEFINGSTLATPSEEEFSPLFRNNALTVQGSVAYDINQPDRDSDPNNARYSSGTLAFEIPEIGLSVSQSSNFMQISSFNSHSTRDEFFAFSIFGTGAFTSDIGLDIPLSLSVALFGDTSLLPNNQLPTGDIDFTFANLSLNFMGSDNTSRQILFTFSPSTTSVVPVPAALWLMASGLLGLISFSHKINKS